MTITVVFDPPLPSDSPATFNTKAFSTLGDLNDWSTEANALAADVTSKQSTASTAATTATTQAGNASSSAGTATTQAGIATAAAASVNAIEATTHAATSKTTPVDADEIPLADSAATFGLKKLTWANLKATLATWLGGGTIAGSFTTLTSSGNATLGDAEATDTHTIKGATTVLANSANPALKVTQTGAGNAFVVEDQTSTDPTPFVINSGGIVNVAHPTAVTGSSAAVMHLQVAKADNEMLGAYQFNAASSGPTLEFGQSNNATVGSHTVVALNDNLGVIKFSGSDGTNFIRGAQISAAVDGTPGTNDMPGRLVFSTTPAGSVAPVERMRIDSSGQIGFPSVSTGVNAYFSKNMTGATTAVGLYSVGQVQSGVTAGAYYFRTFASTAAAAFTVPELIHYDTIQSTLGAGSVVTVQTGFQVRASLVGAVTNYGFYGGMPSGTGRWNFYAGNDARNYFVGKTAVGDSTDFAAVGAPSLTGGGASVGVMAVNAGAAYFQSYNTTAAADKKIWRFGNNASGDLVFQTVNDAYGSASTKATLASSGNLLVNTAAGLGYGAGAGGTVTQATSKSTAVTLNKPCGRITTTADALAAGASVTFTVNNTVCITDAITAHRSSGGSGSAYTVKVASSFTNGFEITLTNTSAGSLSEAVVITFAINKVATT